MNDTNQPKADRVRSACPRAARWAHLPALFFTLAVSPWHAIAQAPQFTQIYGGQTRIATRLSTAATDTVTQADCGRLISYSNPVATAVSLPVATSLSSGCWIDIQNTSPGPLTITPNTSTIDGASSLVLSSNQGVLIVDSTDQYLTQRGQGSAGGGSGSGAAYSGDGATLTLIGTTFSVNTAAVATRVTAAQGIDSTCAIGSGSSSTYVGTMRGNALTTYADGMRIIAEVDTTSAGNAITLDCGAGAKAVYQYDGVSNPSGSQWASGGQVLLAYSGALNGGAGAWRILSGGSTGGGSGSTGTGGGTATPVAVTSSFDLPIGGMNSNASGCLPDWDVTGATYPYCFGFSSGRLPGLYLGNTATPSATKTFTWPSNWDSTTPVNILVTWTGSYSDTNSMKIAASLACVTASLSNLTDATFGSAASSPTLSNTYFFRNTAIANVNANGCAAGQLGILKIARDNTITSNSADPLGIVGVAIQWTSH